MDDSTAHMADGLARGDEEAFALLYDREGSAMYRVARAICGSSDAAEDAVQDVFLALARAGATLSGVRDLRAYVFSALRRAAWRCVERMRRVAHADIDPDALSGPARAVDAERDLDRALRRLTDDQREVVALKIDGGLTFEEIGETLGISPNTAASRYRYALEKLRDSLEAHE